MTAIADADLQRLLDRLVSDATKAGADYLSPKRNEQCEVSYNTFCAALNERLEAAERTVHKLENIKRYEVIDANGIYPTEFVHRRAGRFLMWKDVNELLAAYRQSKERRE